MFIKFTTYFLTTHGKAHKLQKHKPNNSSSFDLCNTWTTTEKSPYGHTHIPTPTTNRTKRTTLSLSLSRGNTKFLKGSRIARHDIATHQLTNLLKSNLHTKHLALINIGNRYGNEQDNIIPPSILSCTCNNTQYECLTKHIDCTSYAYKVLHTNKMTNQYLQWT